MEKPILSNINIESHEPNNQTLVGTLYITFPNCDHMEHYRRISNESYEKTAKNLIEKQSGLCGVCYSAYCNKNKLIPWYSK